ncbi:hypothetical protein BDW_02365 [Bdellovibrio bacteriovorus W]|nr:hypothetical protein BDW_02365 [Bdellovibrio bacteriovorus W]
MTTLEISRKCYDQILAWSLSYAEIGFICAGRERKITHVFRVPNVADDTRNRYKWDQRIKRDAMREIEALGLKVIAEGHSHPSPRHEERPSQADLEYFSLGRPHIIAFPCRENIRGWFLGGNIRQTLRYAISLVVT